MHNLSDSDEEALIVLFIFFLLLLFVGIALVFVGLWKINRKAGKPGWAALVPFYNSYITGKIANSSDKLTIALVITGALNTILSCKITIFESTSGSEFAPLVAYVFSILWIITMFHLASAFGQSTGFALGMVILPSIFLMILGFNNNQYQCPQPRIPYAAKPINSFGSMKYSFQCYFCCTAPQVV